MQLFEIDNAKDHYLNTTVGGKVSYSFLSIENTKISLKGMVGTSLSNKNWKYTYYDGGVFIEGGKESTKPFVGFGYRYYDSRNDLFSNYSTFYMSLGFSFEFL